MTLCGWGGAFLKKFFSFQELHHHIEGDKKGLKTCAMYPYQRYLSSQEYL